MERRSVVIGGGGLTAATAVGTLRERGFDGRIALVAVERHEPYIRPPLSKGYLAGRDGLDEVFVHPSSWYTDNAVELLLGTRVDEVDPGQGAEVVYRGDPDAQECLAFWTRGGWVVAGISLNVWDVNDQVQRIIRTGKRVDSASLADVAIPLSAL
jgi:3-phenylpropionate/trans-cinnamate dioxygenase ferredoxin reductase component